MPYDVDILLHILAGGEDRIAEAAARMDRPADMAVRKPGDFSIADRIVARWKANWTKLDA